MSISICTLNSPPLERDLRFDPEHVILNDNLPVSDAGPLESLIGCCSVLNLRAQITTNHKHCTDLCRAASLEWNF